MIARVLFVTDLHKRWKDSTSVHGQVAAQELIQEELIEFCQRMEVTHVILGGDWYDRGFHGIGQAFSAMEMDRRLSDSVSGNVYLCVGNHFYLERDENPEMYIIQPNDLIKPQIEIQMPEKPIFKLVTKLKLGTVQINFFHFSKINKQYIAERDTDTTFNIGIYHDHCTLPGWITEMEGYSGQATTTYLNDIYRNIDLALHGHIHCKIGSVGLELNTNRKVPLFVPGALAITQNKECFKHADVMLPLLDIDDDSNVSVRICKFSTHMEMLKFYDKKDKKKQDLKELISDRNITVNTKGIQSLPQYLSAKGYGNTQLKLVESASKGLLNLGTAVTILTEVQ